MIEATKRSGFDATSAVLTFLIADVRGYTSFTLDHGDEAAARLAGRFAGVAEEVVSRHDGQVTELRGDEVLAVFTSARNALRAALALQVSLAQAAVNDPSLPLEVGIGLDAGDAVPVKGGYRGGALNLAARLCSIAGGGEVFASETVIGLARKTVGITFVDRGPVTLKGLLKPVRVIQITPEGEISEELPPLQADLSAHPTNLPDESTPFIGREAEITAIIDLLREPQVRLVTVTGTGGVGKTRLSFQVGGALLHAFRDGVFVVPLASLTDPGLLPSAIAGVVEAKEEAGRDLVDTLINLLRDKHLMFVLDNFEHLRDASSVVARLLDGCRELRVLVTSRAPLRLVREHEYAISSLSMPHRDDVADPESLAQYDAIALFVERARAVKPEFALTNENAQTVAEIYSRLDGLPLAIELAAARMRILPPDKLLGRLEQRLPLLTGGQRDAPERQRTLRAAIEWSYNLLSSEDNALFARLSVFSGSFNLEAAEDVCDADLDTLESLLEQSLIRSTEDGRFFYLGTIREFALEKLEASDQAEEVRRRHAEYFLGVAQSANLTNEAEGEQRHDIVIRDRDNVRAALDWTLHAGEVDLGLRLAGSLENYWVTNSPLEGQRWLRELLKSASEVPGEVRALSLRAYGAAEYILGEYEEGTRHYEESLKEYLLLGDKRGIAIMKHRLAFEAMRCGEMERARTLIEESGRLHKEINFKKGEAQAVGLRAQLELRAGNEQLGLELLERSAVLCEESGFTWWRVIMLLSLARLLLKRGQIAESDGRAREGLALAAMMKDRQHTMYAMALLAQAAVQMAEPIRAGRLWGAIEKEQARAPIGQWEEDRTAYAEYMLAHTSPKFEQGLHEGQRLSLSQAVEDALGSPLPLGQ